MDPNSSDVIEDGGKKLSIKFLMPNNYAGSLIGTGGKSIKELIAVSEARVNVSGNNELFPGSNERVVLISGSHDSVSLAQTLIWEMIAQNVKASSSETRVNVDWSPEGVVNSLGTNDNILVTCKVSVPAAAGGVILGKGGESIKMISSESGAKVLMTSKEDALFTQERVLTISGEAGQCVKCVDLILVRLSEQEEVIPFFNRGTTYNSPLKSFIGGGRGGRGGRGSGGRGRNNNNNNGGNASSEIDTETNITISIPNELIGNIFGRQGSTMREIISLSGAKVVVSGKGEFVEGTTNRLVTITGTPTSAQAAHLFITQRLETPSNPPPRKAKK